jgi:hypothetical protein
MVPDLRERQEDSARAKKALLEKFRAAPGPEDPAVAERRAAREALLVERTARAGQREAEKRAHEVNSANKQPVPPNSRRRLNGKPSR